MVDKRALANEALYQNLDKELAEIVSKQDHDKIMKE